MLKIRMQRTGRINMPSYRIVVIEHTSSPQAGKYVELVGNYNPKSKSRNFKEDRIKYWISVGAKPSDTVHNMLVSAGILNTKKINVLPSYKAPAPASEEKIEVKPQSEVEMPPEAALAVEAAGQPEENEVKPQSGEFAETSHEV